MNTRSQGCRVLVAGCCGCNLHQLRRNFVRTSYELRTNFVRSGIEMDVVPCNMVLGPQGCVVSIGVHLPHTPPPHPKIQSCARGPAGPTNVAKSSIDSGATHRNRPFRPNSPFPWFFLACKTVSAALEPHLPPPFSPGIPPKSGSKRRLLPGKRRLLGGKCGSK